jgi:hypothetical protein
MIQSRKIINQNVDVINCSWLGIPKSAPLFSIYRRNIIFTTSVPSEFYNHDPWQRIEVQIGFGNSCPATCFQTRGHRFLMPIFQLLVYHGKNKLHFNEMKSALH